MKVPLAPDVDVKKISRSTPGFSGADLMNIVNEAALSAAKNDQKCVTMWNLPIRSQVKQIIAGLNAPT
jgi:ATP-dependent Zn protease